MKQDGAQVAAASKKMTRKVLFTHPDEAACFAKQTLSSCASTPCT